RDLPRDSFVKLPDKFVGLHRLEGDSRRALGGSGRRAAWTVRIRWLRAGIWSRNSRASRGRNGAVRRLREQRRGCPPVLPLAGLTCDMCKLGDLNLQLLRKVDDLFADIDLEGVVQFSAEVHHHTSEFGLF